MSAMTYGATLSAVLLLAGTPLVSPSPQASGAAETESEVVREGRRLYDAYGCYSCHGHEGHGSPRTGPKLGPDPWPLEEFIRMCREPLANMPAYAPGSVSDEELAKMWEFLASRPQPPESIPLLEDPGPDPRGTQD